MKRFLLCAAIAVAGISFGLESDADACGGCFAPPDPPTVVNDHRMILSISKTQSTLYDQIKYTGSPSSFGWVLPIAGTVDVGLSSDLVFSTLDQQTQTRVIQPPLNCPPFPEGCFQGGSSSGGFNAPSAGSANEDGVSVIKQETVGPYETVQLASDNANALNEWLAKNGYVVPQDVQPVIAAYVAEKFNFLALKLQPGQGVQDMRPVRVTTSGAGAVLPLRMVAAGTGPTVGITLWVISEGRYEPQNFGSFIVAADDVTWDWTTGKSDYVDVRAAKTAAGAGKVWEIESSMSVFRQTVEQIVKNQSSGGEDYEAEKDGQGNVIKTAAEVRAEDLATLFDGIGTASAARVTRMRADLAHAALDQDLQMTASADQTELSNIRQLTREKNQPQCPVYDGCQYVGTAPRDEAIARSSTTGPSSSGSSCAVPPGGKDTTFMAAGLGLAAVTVVQAMRRRRR